MLRLYGVSTISHFLLRNTMRGMVETQYDAASCGSTASLQFRNTMRCMVETQQAASLRYFSFYQKHRDIVVNPSLTKGRHIVGDGLDGDIGGVVAVLVHHVA